MDLVVSGDLRDIVRVARDLGTGRALDERSRTVARALLALTGRWVAWSLSLVGLAVVLGVLEAVVLPQVACHRQFNSTIQFEENGGTLEG